MTTATLNPCMSLRDLMQLDHAISHQLDGQAPRPTPRARLLLRQRRWVRDQINVKMAAQSN